MDEMVFQNAGENNGAMAALTSISLSFPPNCPVLYYNEASSLVAMGNVVSFEYGAYTIKALNQTIKNVPSKELSLAPRCPVWVLPWKRATKWKRARVLGSYQKEDAECFYSVLEETKTKRLVHHGIPLERIRYDNGTDEGPNACVAPTSISADTTVQTSTREGCRNTPPFAQNPATLEARCNTIHDKEEDEETKSSKDAITTEDQQQALGNSNSVRVPCSSSAGGLPQKIIEAEKATAVKRCISSDTTMSKTADRVPKVQQDVVTDATTLLPQNQKKRNEVAKAAARRISLDTTMGATAKTMEGNSVRPQNVPGEKDASLLQQQNPHEQIYGGGNQTECLPARHIPVAGQENIVGRGQGVLPSLTRTIPRSLGKSNRVMIEKHSPESPRNRKANRRNPVERNNCLTSPLMSPSRSSKQIATAALSPLTDKIPRKGAFPRTAVESPSRVAASPSLSPTKKAPLSLAHLLQQVEMGAIQPPSLVGANDVTKSLSEAVVGEEDKCKRTTAMETSTSVHDNQTEPHVTATCHEQASSELSSETSRPSANPSHVFPDEGRKLELYREKNNLADNCPSIPVKKRRLSFDDEMIVATGQNAPSKRQKKDDFVPLQRRELSARKMTLSIRTIELPEWLDFSIVRDQLIGFGGRNHKMLQKRLQCGIHLEDQYIPWRIKIKADSSIQADIAICELENILLETVLKKEQSLLLYDLACINRYGERSGDLVRQRSPLSDNLNVWMCRVPFPPNFQQLSGIFVGKKGRGLSPILKETECTLDMPSIPGVKPCGVIVGPDTQRVWQCIKMVQERLQFAQKVYDDNHAHSR